MFEEFSNCYKVTESSTAETRGTGVSSVNISSINGLEELFNRFGGTSFNDGIYHIINLAEVDLWKSVISKLFPDKADNIVPFSYDWLGQFFCIDLDHLVKNQPQVILCSQLEDNVYNIPCSVIDFHNGELINNAELALDLEHFNQFIKQTHNPTIPSGKCVDLGIPLYLGGEYSVDNMKIVPLEASWELATQLLLQTRDLPPGTNVSEVVTNLLKDH